MYVVSCAGAYASLTLYSCLLLPSFCCPHMSYECVHSSEPFSVKVLFPPATYDAVHGGMVRVLCCLRAILCHAYSISFCSVHFRTKEKIGLLVAYVDIHKFWDAATSEHKENCYLLRTGIVQTVDQRILH